MRSYGIRMCPKSKDWCFYRERRGRFRYTDTQGGNHEDTEAEINAPISQRMPRIPGATGSWERGTGGILS